MTIRSKFLAATLGLVIASGAIGGAFAQSGQVTTSTTTPAASAKVTAATPAKVSTKVSAKVTPAIAKTPIVGTHHRLRIAHRGMHKMVAHRATSHGMFAKKIGRTHLAVSHGLRGKIAKHSIVKTRLVRSHVAKTHLVKARIGKTHLVKAHVAKTRLVKSNLVGTQKHAMAGKVRVIR